MPLVKKLNLSHLGHKLPGLPAVVHQGTYKGLELTVVNNGKHAIFGVDCVGTVGGALTAYAAIQAFSPDILINAGTAGGFKRKGGAIGDTYLGTSCANHDRRSPMPGLDAFCTGKLGSLSTPKLLAATGWKSGIVTTGNSLDHVPADDERMERNDASVKDMEGAAIAEVAQAAGVPFFAIKVVTDIVDGERATEEEFLENLGTAAVSLQKAVPQALDFIDGKILANL